MGLPRSQFIIICLDNIYKININIIPVSEYHWTDNSCYSAMKAVVAKIKRFRQGLTMSDVRGRANLILIIAVKVSVNKKRILTKANYIWDHNSKGMVTGPKHSAAIG